MSKKGLFKTRIETEFGDIIKNTSKNEKELFDFMDIVKKKLS